MKIVIRLLADNVIHSDYVIFQGNAALLLDLSEDYFPWHLPKMLDGHCAQYRRLHLVLSSKCLRLQELLVEFVEEQGLPPDVLEEKELVEFEVVEDEEVEDEARVALLEHGPGFHAEDVVQAVKHKGVLRGLLVVLPAAVVLRAMKWARHREVVDLVNLFCFELFLIDALYRTDTLLVAAHGHGHDRGIVIILTLRKDRILVHELVLIDVRVGDD